MALFRRNHWPILKEQLAAGRYTAVELSTPRFHGEGRADWDILVSITYRDWAAIQEHSDAEIARRLYPDQEAFQAEEPRRFSLLDAHGTWCWSRARWTADLRDTVSPDAHPSGGLAQPVPPITELSRIEPVHLARLEKQGIFTTGILLEVSETPTRRSTLADHVKATPNDVCSGATRP